MGRDKDCTGWKPGNWVSYKMAYISTHLYAVPGKIVTVTIPSQHIGKVQLLINAHTDNLIFKKNKPRWEKGQSPYHSRPGLVWSDYTGGTDRMGSNNTITMMSPYGGSIFVYLYDINEAYFDITIEGAIEMPHFIHGMTHMSLTHQRNFNG